MEAQHNHSEIAAMETTRNKMPPEPVSERPSQTPSTLFHKNGGHAEGEGPHSGKEMHMHVDWFSRPAIHDQRLYDVRELALDSMPKDLCSVS